MTGPWGGKLFFLAEGPLQGRLYKAVDTGGHPWFFLYLRSDRQLSEPKVLSAAEVDGLADFAAALARRYGPGRPEGGFPVFLTGGGA